MLIVLASAWRSLDVEVKMYRLGALFGAFVASPAAADPNGYGHMSGWGYGMGMMFGPILWIIVLGLMVAGVIWLVRRMDGPGQKKGTFDALGELDLRFAKGEIDAEDYTARKKLLTGD